jgi:deoxyribonuclease-4
MLNIGCHLSTSQGFEAMGRTALDIGANTFQFFTRNPRGSQAKDIGPDDALKLRTLMAENGFAQILGHAPYTLNPASAKPEVREFAKLAMAGDLERMEVFPGNLYNFHPGSHVGQGVDEGIRLVVSLLNDLLRPELTTTVLLETMAGKGSEIGGRFEELARIIDGVELGERLGVCLDTCHVFDGGYDVAGDLDGVLGEFDKVIGLDRLKAIHLNDSKNPLGSKKDRHEKIGEGSIGLDAIVRVINHPKLRHLPFYLETPNELNGYAHEIALLRKRYD